MDLARFAAVVSSAVRARAKSEETGLVRSPGTVSLLSRSAAEAISTREGVTCLLPASTVALPWSVVEPEDEREEVDEPFHAEVPRALFRRSPVLLSRAAAAAPVGSGLVSPLEASRAATSTRRPSPAFTIVAVAPAAVVVVATPTIFAGTPGATTPTGSVPAVVASAVSLFPPLGFRQLFLRGRPENGVGGLVVAPVAGPRRGQVSGRLSSVRHWAYNPCEPRPPPLRGRPRAAASASLTSGGRRPLPPPRSPMLRILPSVKTPCTRRCP